MLELDGKVAVVIGGSAAYPAHALRSAEQVAKRLHEVGSGDGEDVNVTAGAVMY